MRENRIRRMDKVSCTLIISTRLVEPKMRPSWATSNGKNGLIFPYNFEKFVLCINFSKFWLRQGAHTYQCDIQYIDFRSVVITRIKLKLDSNRRPRLDLLKRFTNLKFSYQ
jgi:hypothetical protein